MLQLNSVLFSSAYSSMLQAVIGINNKDSLTSRRLCDKLHGRPSQLLARPAGINRLPAIRPQSRFVPTPPAFDAPVRGVPVGILPWRLLRQNYRLAWLHDGANNNRYITRFDRIHERDRRADRQTDRQTPHEGIGRACIASRGKNEMRDLNL